MATVINIDIGKMSSVGKKFDMYSKLLEKAVNDALTEFTLMYKTKLFENMSAYGVPESILGTVFVDKGKNGISVYIASELVNFFEYGTGIKGSTNPHPKPPAGWIYDSNGHGNDGWWYPTTESDPNPYKWRDPSGQLRGWTRGKVSRPFIYATNLWAKRSITNVVHKHIRRIKID